MKKFINPRLGRGFFRFKPSVLVFLWIAATMASCTKEFDTIGIDLIDDKLQVSSKTVNPIASFTEIEDSVPTNTANRKLLGFINDPVFGKTQAGILTEALPRSIPFDIPGSNAASAINVDSVVLSMAYHGYYGDITSPFQLNVYELDEVIPSGTNFSTQMLNYKSTPLYQSSFMPTPNDTIFVTNAAGDTTSILPPHLRIKLDQSLGQRFITEHERTAAFNSNDEYREFFKGLYISVDEITETGSMLYFSLASSLSRIQIYYSVGEDTVANIFELGLYDQLARNYTHFNNFGHEDIADEIKAQVFEGDTLDNQPHLFVQSMANFRTKIKLPDPSSFLGENANQEVAINVARLILPVDTTLVQDTLGFANGLIVVRGGEESGNFYTLQDQVTGTNYFGGMFNKEKMEYSFNISQHLQQVINGTLPNYPLYLRVSGSIENAGRAVIKGNNEEGTGMRLEIQYTHLTQ